MRIILVVEPDWAAALDAEALAKGLGPRGRSELIRRYIRRGLPAAVRQQLTPVRPVGRQKSEDGA